MASTFLRPSVAYRGIFTENMAYEPPQNMAYEPQLKFERPANPQKIQKYQRNHHNFCLLPCDTNQKPIRNCSENLVQKNFIIWADFLGGGFFSFRSQKSNANLSGQSLLRTVRVMDVHTENRGSLRPKMCFPAALVMGRNFLTPGHLGIRVRKVHR